MSDFDLQAKFPDMRPLRSAPSLMTLNGIGVTLYGSRDYDEETNTYVKTRFFCLLFIPIVALDAFRVADATSGWYFLGKVPLSRTAKMWNCLLLAVVLFGGGGWWWHTYTQSPEYIAGRQLADGDRLAEAGQLGKAARVYRDVARGKTPHAPTAAEKIKNLVGQPAGNAPPADAAEVFQVAVELRDRFPSFRDVFPRGMELVNQHADANPSGALAVLEAITPLAPEPKELAPRRQQLLERVVAQEPDNPEPAGKLAAIHEARRELDKCEALLTPHVHRLGITEGARILGQIYAHQGKLDQAIALLTPYTEGRLQRLRAAEQTFTNAIKNARQQIGQSLNSRKAPGFPYARHETANNVEKETMVEEYIQSRIKDDPDITAAREALMREADVVAVAIDLGIVLLRRGQALTDPEARRAELQKAEKTFLAVRGLAGESDEYRLSLGQVYYWLGKHAEGRKLFDELLAAQKRDFDTLVGVSHLLREVGAPSEARALVEEAYNKESDTTKKYQAARLRSVLHTELDDEIAWLRRCNPADLEAKASLSTALGQQAIREGKDPEAAGHLREAIALYAKQPVSAATLNNGALAYFSLYAVTGDRADLDKGGEMIDKAIALQPSDSILLHNAADTMLAVAWRDLIGSAIDFKALKSSGSQELLAYLYRDRADRDQYAQRVRQHPGVAKAVAYYDRLMVLAPKSAGAYAVLASLYYTTRNGDGLRGLAKRLDAVDLDLADADRETFDYLAGKKDAKRRQDRKGILDRYEKLVAETRKGPDKPTFAVAACRLASLQMELAQLGQVIDPNRVVALAEEAHAAAPSRATRQYMTAALLFRAHRGLIAREPAYAALAAQFDRSLGSSYLVATTLSHDGPARAAVRAHPDVQRVQTLLQEAQATFPDEPDPWTWAMLRDAQPAAAAAVAQALLQDELGRTERAIASRLSPLNAVSAMSIYWASQAAGDEPRGRAALQACADRGVPVPFVRKGAGAEK